MENGPEVKPKTTGRLGVGLQHVALIGAAGLVGVSGWMNAEFGRESGHIAFMWLLIFSDCLKVGAQVAIGVAFRQRAVLLGSLSLAALALTASLSAVAGFGFVANHRSEVAQEALGDLEARGQILRDIDRAETELNKYVKLDSLDVLRAREEAARKTLRWTQTNACTDATVLASIAFCADYALTLERIEKAHRRETLTTTLATLRGTLRTLTSRDPGAAQANAMARLSGWDARLINDAVTILMVVVAEVGSAIGFIVAVAIVTTKRGTNTEPPPGPKSAPAAATGEPQRAAPKPKPTKEQKRWIAALKSMAKGAESKVVASQRKLAEALKCSVSTASRRLKQLEELGHIEVNTSARSTEVVFSQ